MKRLTAILLSIVCLLTFAACAANSEEGSHGEETWAKDWGITLTVQDVTSSGLTLICSQSGGIAEGRLETGSEYWIEKSENNSWVKVEPLADPIWDMMAHGIRYFVMILFAGIIWPMTFKWFEAGMPRKEK